MNEIENDYREIVNILWTGGWDSTYRVVELSMRPVDIQPIYVRSPLRQSVKYELNAIKTITQLLLKKPKTQARFLPVIIIEKNDIPKNERITQAFKFFEKEAGMGDQHDYLARLALDYPMMELCIEKGTGNHTPIRDSITAHGRLIDTGDGVIIDKEHSSEELNLVLGNMRLPIFNITEVEMYQRIKEIGYEDVMSHIWFCHNPIKGKPCGLCSPCTTKMTAGMTFLLSPKAQKRNIIMRRIEKIFGKYGKYAFRKVIWKLYQ